MKLHHYLFSISTVFLFACEKQILSKELAQKLITAEYKLPEVVDYTISAGDPTVAKTLLDLGLEKDGLVKITRRQTLSQMGTPWILFTERGKAYFLPTQVEDIKHQRQNVKIAIKEFGAVTGIVMGKENKTAIVKFSFIFKDLTPFSKLLGGDLSKPNILEAFFIKYDTGWTIDNEKGVYMLMGL